MGKRLLNLYVEDADVEIAKSRGLNISQFVRDALAIEVGVRETRDEKSKDEVILELKTRNAHLSTELNTTAGNLRKANKELGAVKEQLARKTRPRPTRSTRAIV